jgi:renalase
MKKRIAIIGAGIAGLTLANRLRDSAEVIVFEKARGVGGRMATRRAEEFSFDHGAQFFTARDAAFKRFLLPSLNSGLIQEWKGKVITLTRDKKPEKRLWFEPHYVCCPGMNSLCKKLAEGIDVRLLCEIAPLESRAGKQWELFDKDRKALGSFDFVISTAPSEQTTRLFSDFVGEAAGIRSEELLPCFSIMIGFSRPWPHSWIAAKVLESPLEWIAVNSSKPGRNQGVTSLVAQTSNLWAQKHIEEDQGEVLEILRKELASILPQGFADPSCVLIHRWRFALLEKAQDDDLQGAPFFDSELKLASVGDWCSRSRIENVWLDAHRLADRFLESQ